MKNKKIVLIIASAFLLLLVFIALEKTRTTNIIDLPFEDGVSEQNGPTSEEQVKENEANADAKRKLLESIPADDQSSQTQSERTTELSARQEGNNSVTVLTKLFGYTSGTCQLTVTNAGKTNTQSARVAYQTEFSSCAGFSVPINSLGTGIWNIALTVTTDDSSESKNITYEVK